jgi:hypothetical protein
MNRARRGLEGYAKQELRPIRRIHSDPGLIGSESISRPVRRPSSARGHDGFRDAHRDGVYFNVRLDKERSCVLGLI